MAKKKAERLPRIIGCDRCGAGAWDNEAWAVFPSRKAVHRADSPLATDRGMLLPALVLCPDCLNADKGLRKWRD